MLNTKMAVDRAPVPEERLWNRGFITVIITNCLVFLSAHTLLATFPVYAQQLGATDRFIGILAGLFFISAVIFRPFAGKAVDTWNRRRIYILGLVIIAPIIIAYNFAQALSILLALRFVHGMGWSAATTAANTMATDSIPRHRLAEGLGYYGLSHTFSMVIAPALGLYIAHNWGYGSLFYSSSGMAALALIILLFRKNQNVMVKVTTGKTIEKPVMFEKRAFQPTVIGSFVSFTFCSIPGFIALAAAQNNIPNIGFYFTVQALTAVVSRMASGRLIDRKGFNVVMFPGFSFMALCMVIISLAHTFPVFLLAAFAGGLGFGLVQPAVMAMAISKVPPERRGAANSTYLFGMDLAIGLGSAAWGLTAELIGYSAMYLLAVIPVMCAFIIYLFTEKPRPFGVSNNLNAS